MKSRNQYIIEVAVTVINYKMKNPKIAAINENNNQAIKYAWIIA